MRVSRYPAQPAMRLYIRESRGCKSLIYIDLKFPAQVVNPRDFLVCNLLIYIYLGIRATRGLPFPAQPARG
jgi:hypothetical protein